MGNFRGTLNSKSVYGQSYGDSECFRLRKLNKVYNWGKTHNPLTRKWCKYPQFLFPSWGKSLWNYGGEITWTQRQENKGRKNKRIEFYRWKTND